MTNLHDVLEMVAEVGPTWQGWCSAVDGHEAWALDDLDVEACSERLEVGYYELATWYHDCCRQVLLELG